GDRPVGDGPVLPAAHVAALVRLQALVDVEEVRDLVADVLVDVAQVADAGVADVPRRDAEDLGVGTALVEHPAHADPADGQVGSSSSTITSSGSPSSATVSGM